MDATLSLERIIDQAASATLKGVRVSDVRSIPSIGADGSEVLLVTIVTNSSGGHEVTGDTALDTIVQVQHALQAVGESRFPIIEFVREGEFNLDGDTQP